MGIASAISGGVGAATGLVSTISEMGNKKKIARAINGLPENKLTNIADGMQVSTRGADLQKEQQAQLASTQTGALAEGGSRSLIGGIGQVAAGSQDVNAKIGANLDEQQQHINDVRAQDEGNIRTTKEQRAQAKLAALSGQYNASSQNMMQGIGNVIQGAGIVGSAYANSKKSAADTK